MAIKNRCVSCHQVLSAPDEMRGQRIACPSCGHKNRLISADDLRALEEKEVAAEALRKQRERDLERLALLERLETQDPVEAQAQAQAQVAGEGDGAAATASGGGVAVVADEAAAAPEVSDDLLEPAGDVPVREGESGGPPAPGEGSTDSVFEIATATIGVARNHDSVADMAPDDDEEETDGGAEGADEANEPGEEAESPDPGETAHDASVPDAEPDFGADETLDEGSPNASFASKATEFAFPTPVVPPSGETLQEGSDGIATETETAATTAEAEITAEASPAPQPDESSEAAGSAGKPEPTPEAAEPDDDAKPADAKPADAKPADAMPAEAKPAEAKKAAKPDAAVARKARRIERPRGASSGKVDAKKKKGGAGKAPATELREPVAHDPAGPSDSRREGLPEIGSDAPTPPRGVPIARPSASPPPAKRTASARSKGGASSRTASDKGSARRPAAADARRPDPGQGRAAEASYEPEEAEAGAAAASQDSIMPDSPRVGRLKEIADVLLFFAYILGLLGLVVSAASVAVPQFPAEVKLFGALGGFIMGAFLYVTFKYLSEITSAMAEVAHLQFEIARLITSVRKDLASGQGRRPSGRS